MSCDQELCPNWTGDGDVCACVLFDLDRGGVPCGHFVAGGCVKYHDDCEACVAANGWAPEWTL